MADAYKTGAGIGLNYQSIGYGGGIKQIEARTDTVGATDVPLKAEDLGKFCLVQFPMVMGGIVPVVNLPGIKPGDVVLGLASEGLHTNGYSLARQALLEDARMDLDAPVAKLRVITLGHALLWPHCCHAPAVLPLLEPPPPPTSGAPCLNATAPLPGRRLGATTPPPLPPSPGAGWGCRTAGRSLREWLRVPRNGPARG